MDWITGLQSSINYIENNLTKKLDYNEISKKAYSSSFHFQRVFSILCGYTIGEYIRNRRLTLAGNELSTSNTKVIDIALKYGYDSPESFSRAFTKFHGITPSQAKANGAKLKSFSPLSVKLILEGGTTMNYKIVKKDAFDVIVRKEHFRGGCEIGKQQIQKLWKQCNDDGTISHLCKYVNPESIFGNAIIGFSFDNPDEGDFDYAIGTTYQGEKVNKGLTVIKIPEYTWAVFPCVGAMPDAFTDLWGKIYTEFFPTSEYQPSSGMCLEVYPSEYIHQENYSCEIWISVNKK